MAKKPHLFFKRPQDGVVKYTQPTRYGDKEIEKKEIINYGEFRPHIILELVDYTELFKSLIVPIVTIRICLYMLNTGITLNSFSLKRLHYCYLSCLVQNKN
jgi:hypothetical protein